MEVDAMVVYVHDWDTGTRQCATCGTASSVKYDCDGKQYCNICVLQLAHRSE